MTTAKHTRRSAKMVVNEMADSMLMRNNDPHVGAKLDVIQTIASRMGWNDLFEKLKHRHRFQRSPVEESAEPKEKWWQK